MESDKILAQAQIPLRLSTQQILAAILLLSDKEKKLLQKSIPSFEELQGGDEGYEGQYTQF